ncbi:MAG: CpsD/CapB family tyrosine-protein kinase [Gemmobacter sp.]
MTSHTILLADARPATHLGQPDMDEDQFRKLSQEKDRPVRAGAGLFRHGTGDAPAQGGDADPVANLPVLSFRHNSLTPARVWESLPPVSLDAGWLTGNGLFPNSSTDPAPGAFDILRTRIMLAFQENGWRRIAVTSPTHGCGKSTVAANLALSLARRPGSRTVLMDLELRRPGLAALLGVPEPGLLRDFLTGTQPLETHFQRVGRTLALALNGTPVPDAAELLQAPDTTGALVAMMEQLDPEVVVYDLPPVLVSDDVIGFAPQVDAVLLVADGTQTTADEVKACERLFEGRVLLLGVVLNRAQDVRTARYRYGRKRR